MKLATEERSRKQGETNRISFKSYCEQIVTCGSTSPRKLPHSRHNNQKWYNEH